MAAKKPTYGVILNASDENPILEPGARFGFGAKSLVWWPDAGVQSVTDVERLGAIEVCRHVLVAGHPVAVVCAHALDGGLNGYGWDAIPATRKSELQREFAAMKRQLKRNPAKSYRQN